MRVTLLRADDMHTTHLCMLLIDEIHFMQGTLMENLYHELDIPWYEEIRKCLENKLITDIPNDRTTVSCIGQSGSPTATAYEDILSDLLRMLGMPRVNYMANIVKAGEKMVVHIDESTEPWSLLLPIRNTKGTFLNFYRSDNPPYREYGIDNLGNEISWLTVKDIDNIETIHSLEIINPTFIYQQVLHNVVNETDGDRLTLSLVCQEKFNPFVYKRYFKD